MEGIITVDIGTTSMRAILYNGSGQARHTDQRENLPDYHSDGRVEQDAAAWETVLSAVLASCAQAAREHGLRPVAISVTAQRSSVIPVDEGGGPLHPAIMWQDRRTAALAQAMDAENPWVYRKTGLKISPVFSALKMAWFRTKRPDIWGKTHKLIGIQDWTLYLLTGRFVTDHTFGSRTNLMDLTRRQWDDAMLELFGVERSKLCDLVAPGSIVGGLAAAMATATGLPAGLPVVTAGGDQQCAALGLGLFSGERAVSNTGTGSYLIGHAGQPAFDPGMRLACNVSAVPDAYVVEAAVLTSGTIYRWFRENLSGDLAGGDPFEALNALAARTPPGANGLLMLPHFKGCGAPYWDPQAKGVFYNVSLSTTRGEMARAILEGIAMEMKESLELVENLCGRVASVSVSGGLTKSALFNQIQSDIFERPVVRYANGEASSLGAWIGAAVALGLADGYQEAFELATVGAVVHGFEPEPATLPVYERQRRQSRALYQALSAPGFRAQF